jgi:hypothetical protein
MYGTSPQEWYGRRDHGSGILLHPSNSDGFGSRSGLDDFRNYW